MADLTTVDKVRTHLGLKGIEADGVLASLVTASSAWVQSQIGRTFGTRTVTETRNGDGTSRLLLRQTPAVSVTSVTVNGETIPARSDVNGDGWVLSDDGVDLVGITYGVDLDGAVPTVGVLIGRLFTRGIQNVVIVYTAGEECPADLEQAVIEHVALRYRDRGREGLGSASVGGDSATFSPAGGSLAFINSVLDAYRGAPIG